MKQITKWKLKNKKSNVKINGLKTIYVKGQELYFDGFNALSFDTQPNSKGKTLEYVLNKDGKLEHLKNNNKQFFVLPCEQNKYFWVSKSKNNNQRPINGIRGRALNPLINNKKKLDILQRCLLKHYFGININTESSSNIPIQIVYYVRSIEKLFVLYINEITNSLNNQFYNQNKNIEKQIDLFTTTYFKDEKYSITYNETKWTKKNVKVEKRNFDQNKLKIEKLIKTIIYFKQFYQNIYSYLENDIQNKQKEENENEKIYKILQILSFIRNNYVLGLFKENLNDTNDLKNIVQKNAVELLKTKINEFEQKYQSAKLYQLSKFILNRINWFIDIKNIDDNFYKFILNNKAKNFGISIKKIRECIINKEDKEKYIKQKSIRYVNMCYDFLIWYFLSKKENQSMTNKFLRFLQENKNEELNKIYKQKIYPEIKNKYKKYFNKLKSQFYSGEFVNIIEHYEFKQKLKNLDKEETESITNDGKTNQPPYFAGFVYAICCFLDNKEINEFTNFLIKYLVSIKSLINICETNIFSNNKLIFKHFYECYSTFKPDNISKIINYLYKIQIISNLGKKINTINENDKEKWLEYVYKLFSLSDDNKNNKEIKNLLISNIAKSRKFAYVLKHVNLSSSIKLFENKQLVKFIISNQISKQQINKWFYWNNKKNKEDKQIEDNKIEELTNQIFELKIIDNNNQTQYLFQIYLSILYLFIKSLKRINVLYAMAWITYDQDWYLLKKYKLKTNPIHEKHEDYDDSDYKFYITKEMILENDNICGKNKKSQIFKKIIENLIQKFDKFMDQNRLIKKIRNSVIHFDIFRVINDYITEYNPPDPKKITYFNIYQFLFQSSFVGNNKNKQIDLFKKILIGNEENNFNNIYDSKNNVILEYSKKFLKVMNLPFAYCIARYKQLTNEQIFNKLQKFGKNNIKN